MIATKHAFNLLLNGEQKEVYARGSDTLLNVLRGQLGLTGAKPACENGDCDACTVLVAGKPMKSCLILAQEMANCAVTTIEGLHNTPMQQAFIQKGAVQCGYCTPAFILNSHALVTLHPDASDEFIDDWLASNLCRCTSYQEIKEAVKAVLAGEFVQA